MCFCAGASFAISFSLLLVGITATRFTKHWSLLPFAFVPMLFSFQQAAEGALWLNLQNHGPAWLITLCTYLFLIFAYVIWPTWIPWSLSLLEKNNEHKNMLRGLLIIGLVQSILLFVGIITFGAEASIDNNHIRYVTFMPYKLNLVTLFLYAIPTVASFFVSTLKGSWFYGITLALSCAVTYIVWIEYLTSIWCFFAAALSIGILFTILEQYNPNGKQL